MEKLVLLIYGENVPSSKHIGKIARKYGKYYMRDMKKEDFHEGDYYEVRIDHRYTGLTKRDGGYSQVTAVKREYFLKFINIFKSISSNVSVCSENHEHPSASLSGLEFEGYCYYLKEKSQKIMFLDACWKEIERISTEELYKKLDFKNPDWSLFSPKTETYDITEMEWYRAQELDKRWLIVGSNKDTGREFKNWIKGLMQKTK
jgi:hypothetical protein